uniref:Uncharacterized protein n=1 Tax=Spironucleus salmonicida TaxID=348837 RepID=V6LRQ3_9EUKA|eukprot:EST46943.1 Hypothetical protein SS50377_13014 [Spironucleus salmonicida]
MQQDASSAQITLTYVRRALRTLSWWTITAFRHVVPVQKAPAVKAVRQLVLRARIPTALIVKECGVCSARLGINYKAIQTATR